jgi:hypothetical protein
MGNSDDIEVSGATKTYSHEFEGEPSKVSIEIGRENIHHALKPHESYEGAHRWDPYATWTPAEERKVLLKTDLMLLSWLCVMVGTLPTKQELPGLTPLI